MPAERVDEEIAAVEAELLAASSGRGPRVLSPAWWNDQVLEWALRHPDFKTQLFRFVDVLPACRSDDDVLAHLDEYFDGVTVPKALELGIDLAEHVPLGAAITAAVARRNVARIARQFIVGATPEAALPRLRRLWTEGMASTVDLLGEKTLSDAEADRYAGRVAELVRTLGTAAPAWPGDDRLERDPWGEVPRINVSVKPTALSPRFGPLTFDEGVAEALERLRPALGAARELDATIHLDTEHDEAKDLTFELLRRIGDEDPALHLGCVVQAYRHDARADLHALTEWARGRETPLQVRLVRGAYWDAETIVAGAAGWPSPVFATKPDTDTSYQRCAEHLLEAAGAVRPLLATHNVRSIAHGIVTARRLGLEPTAVEFQQLYGMAGPVLGALVERGQRVRVYAPIGELVAGLGYLIRRLLENTSNENFVRRHFGRVDAGSEPSPPGATEADGSSRTVGTPVATAERAADDPGPFVNEPHAELRRAPVRERVLAAVASVRAELGFAAPVLVDGCPVPTTDEIVSVDPGCVDRVVCRSGRAGPEHADDAIEVATRAHPGWRDASWAERAAVLFRAAVLLRERREELAALEVFEAGKPIVEADADVCEAIDFCEYYGREALRLGRGVAIDQAPGELNAYRYEPRGIAAVISPWNFPLAIPAGMVSAALVTGNAVILKPAEQTPGVALRLVEILYEAGVPPGVLAYLPGVGEDVGAHLVSHPAVSTIVFTGSREVGLGIVREAAVHRDGQRHVKRVIAEMGGKNAIVVDADADLDVAVPAIVTSACSYAGQKCSAASRVVAVGAIADELIERLAGAAAVVPVGHPEELRTVCGPLIDADAHDRVRRYRELAHREGVVVHEGSVDRTDGWYVAPTVVVVDAPDAAVATDEIFGPVLTVLRAPDFASAVELANRTDYALTAGVFSRTPSHLREAAGRLRAGNVYVNRSITGALVGRQPFGGYGLSGVGSKAGGPDYLLQLVEPHVVTENTVRQGFAPEQPGASGGRNQASLPTSS